MRNSSPDFEDLNTISGAIVDAAYNVHVQLGPGLLESVYEIVLAKELEERGFHVERQKPVPIEYNGRRFDEGFRADLVVNNAVIVELKSVEQMNAVHPKQLLTYLRLSQKRLGLLINFGAATLKDGIKRIVN